MEVAVAVATGVPDESAGAVAVTFGSGVDVTVAITNPGTPSSHAVRTNSAVKTMRDSLICFENLITYRIDDLLNSL